MQKPKSRTANGLANIRSLLTSPDAAPPLPWSVGRIKAVSEVKVHVLGREHANCDSLPLRFGVHFPSDAVITLKRLKFLFVDSTYSDRFHVDAWFSLDDGEEHSGHFVLGTRRGYSDLVMVTVWRHDSNTESRLSEVMIALRAQGFLTPKILLELHPLYRDGQLSTSVDLIKQLAQKMSAQQVSSMKTIVDEALVKADAAIAERDQALDRARHAEDAAQKNASIANILQIKNVALASRVEELEAEKKRFLREQADAEMDGKVASLSTPDTLVDVLENQLHKGSSCTILIMGDGSKRFMKTATFDRDGRVTAKAKSLRDRRVRISCWDRIDRPEFFSSQGYFRNVYVAE